MLWELTRRLRDLCASLQCDIFIHADPNKMISFFSEFYIGFHDDFKKM